MGPCVLEQMLLPPWRLLSEEKSLGLRIDKDSIGEKGPEHRTPVLEQGQLLLDPWGIFLGSGENLC